MSSKEIIIKGELVIKDTCQYYEANGECHAFPYKPGVGVVPAPSLVEYGTGGPNYAVSMDTWCGARHGATDWQEKEVSVILAEAQIPCTRYKKGWPRTRDGLEIYDEEGRWIRGIGENGEYIIKEAV